MITTILRPATQFLKIPPTKEDYITSFIQQNTKDEIRILSDKNLKENEPSYETFSIYKKEIDDLRLMVDDSLNIEIKILDIYYKFSFFL